MRVPVLSLQRTSIPAISSIAVILLVIAPCQWENEINFLVNQKNIIMISINLLSTMLFTHLLRETVRTDSQCYRQNRWHGNRNASNQENEKIVDSAPVRAVLNREHDYYFKYHPHSNGANAEVPDGGEHLQNMH